MGELFELHRREALIELLGENAYLVPKTGSSGFDAVVIDPDGNRIDIYEYKTVLKILEQRASSKGVPSGASTTLDPLPDDRMAERLPEGASTGGAGTRHATKHPEDLVSGQTVTKRGSDGQQVSYENKISAVTENFGQNWEAVLGTLSDEFEELERELRRIQRSADSEEAERQLGQTEDEIKDALRRIEKAQGFLERIAKRRTSNTPVLAIRFEVLDAPSAANVEALVGAMKKVETIIGGAVGQVEVELHDVQRVDDDVVEKMRS